VHVDHSAGTVHVGGAEVILGEPVGVQVEQRAERLHHAHLGDPLGQTVLDVRALLHSCFELGQFVWFPLWLLSYEQVEGVFIPLQLQQEHPVVCEGHVSCDPEFLVVQFDDHNCEGVQIGGFFWKQSVLLVYGVVALDGLFSFEQFLVVLVCVDHHHNVMAVDSALEEFGHFEFCRLHQKLLLEPVHLLDVLRSLLDQVGRWTLELLGLRATCAQDVLDGVHQCLETVHVFEEGTQFGDE